VAEKGALTEINQLFLFDPNGIKIELNFANAEAKGRKPRAAIADRASTRRW